MYRSKKYKRAPWTLMAVSPFVFLGYGAGLVIALCWYWWDWEFSERDLRIQLRCILFLAMCSLCSSRGRGFLVSVAFIFVSIGPATNILANLEVLLRSLACGQELLRLALGQMLDVILEPVNAIRLAVDLMLQEVNKVLNQIMSVLLRMQVHLIVVIDTLKNCAEWLKSILDLCNTEMGSPWARCKETAHKAMVRCQAKMGVLKAVCHFTKFFLALCYPAKLIDVFCSGYWDFTWDLLDKILLRYREFVRHIEQMFDANITFEHKFFFDTNASKSLSDVGEEIMKDINERLSPFYNVQSFTDVLSMIMFSTVFLKAIVFYIRYMNSRHFQNVYITKKFEQLDQRYVRHGFYPVLPLGRLETPKYMKITSGRLTVLEIFSIVENTFFMMTACLQIFTICLLDYGLFWLLAMMSYYGHQEKGLEVPAYIDLEIKGGGFVADVMRGIAGAFRPLTQKTTIDSNLCLPLPIEPNYIRYVKMLVILLLAWILVALEPYILRTRHIIMEHFYPKRAVERRLFLYRKISESRITNFKFERRRVRNEIIHQGKVSTFRWLTWLRVKFSCCCCCCPLGDHCIICERLLTSSNSHFCNTPNCKGIYCDECYEESKHKCCICKHPLEYGDFSDCSEVEDSSEVSEGETYKEQTFREICKVEKPST
ncbi:DC-STAMP domain-containing protein 2-like isoform X2 [Drosophila serrata]|uniref:DC-STAMP domain-containing protein 2-like isoform X2 n=1 Tax=Drosophila serrata TaxID=7274 RepID=UPI000A1D1F59|nr:DC-STAMP domain-containing protein 2-like isoform X2 [Drosophila serrata]